MFDSELLAFIRLNELIEFIQSFGTLYVFLVLAVIVNLEQGIVALDQWVNTRLGGYADETISARSYRNRVKKKRWAFSYKLINCIFFWQDDHCKKAFENEIARMHMSKEYRS